jgi:asparagine synthase (glutamine-hydrolysing)
MTALERHLDWVSYFRRDELAGILTSDMRAELGVHDPCAGARRAYGEGAALGALGALARLDAVTYLPDDVLTKVDRASMLNSLEARVPLLDHKVVEFAATIPWRYKLRGPAGKWILREAVRDLLPPETLVRPKQGFAPPIGHWLGADFGRLAREVLLDSRTSSRGFFDPAAVERLLARTDLRVDHQARKIWALVWFEVWARTYLDRPGTAVATPLDGWNGSIPKAQTT